MVFPVLVTKYELNMIMKRFIVYIFLLLILPATLGACGIKPDKVDPPAGSENQVFPDTYPDISTDPSAR
jgi:hypothetical protein